MKFSWLNSQRLPAAAHGSTPMPATSGRIVAEVGCWIVGIALIAGYLSATTFLENQRTEGLALFAQARATVGTSEQPEVLPLVGEIEQTPGQVLLDTTALDTRSLPIAVLRMPAVGLEVPVYSDISELNLSRGAGWIDGTAAPDKIGNMAIAAHRDRHFRPLKDVQLGDLLELESLTGPREFRVSRILIVDPDDVSVLDDAPVPMVTLVTCFPFYFVGNAPQRYIVQAIAVEHTVEASFLNPTLTARPSGETL